MFFCALLLQCLVANNFDIFGNDTLILAYLTALDGCKPCILKASLLLNISQAVSQSICREISNDRYILVQLYHCSLVVTTFSPYVPSLSALEMSCGCTV